MVLALPLLACVAVTLALGRTFAPLASLQLRAVWAAAASLAIQVMVLGVFPGGSRPLHAALHVLSYGLAGWFVIANRALPGVRLVAVGGLLNLVAILANGGVMPASRAAMDAAGMHATGGFENSAVLDQPHLLFLGDVIPVPGPAPLRNVLSVGDLVLVAAALVLLVRCSARHSRRAVPRA